MENINKNNENLNRNLKGERRYDVELLTYNPIYRTFGKRRKVFSKVLTNASSSEIGKQVEEAYANGFIKPGGDFRVLNLGIKYPEITQERFPGELTDEQLLNLIKFADKCKNSPKNSKSNVDGINNSAQDKITIGGISGLDLSLYREQPVKTIAENSDVSIIPFIFGDLSERDDRIIVNPDDKEYITKIFKSYSYFCRKVREENLSLNKAEEYNLALKIIDKFCLKDGKPLAVKIGNQNEGTPTQVLYHLSSDLLNSHKTTKLIQSVVCDEEGRVREEFEGAFVKNFEGVVRPVYSDKYIAMFSRSRFKELGIDKFFTFKSGSTKLKSIRKKPSEDSNLDFDDFDKEFNSF